MPRAAGYGRVSTQKQEMSIAVQEDQVKKYWEWRFRPHGIEWMGWYADPATSGSSPFRERTAAATLLKRLEIGDHIVIAKMDRAFRNAGDCYAVLEHLKNRQINVHFLDLMIDTSTPVGQLLVGILAVVSQFERERIRERTMDVRKELKRQGFAYRHAPYGFKNVRADGGRKKMVPNQQEIDILHRIFTMSDGGYSAEEIARWLNTQGLRTRPGNLWTRDFVLRRKSQTLAMVGSGRLPNLVLPESLRSAMTTPPSDSGAEQ